MAERPIDSSPAPLPIDPAIVAAARRLSLSASALAPVGGRSFLVRAEVDGATIRLRRWPDVANPRRVAFVNRLQADLASSEPRVASPWVASGHTTNIVECDDAFVDVQTWLPGHPPGESRIRQLEHGHTLHYPAPLSDERLAGLIDLIAGIHEASQRIAQAPGPPVATVRDLLEGVGQSWRLARLTLRPIAPTYPPVQRWLRLGELLLPAAERAIGEADLQQKRPAVVHGGLWPAHVLAERAGVVGLLDFSAAVVTTPLLDVAQLVTRFAGWSAEHAEQVLAPYSEAFHLSPEERRTLPAVAALDLVVEAARLLRLAYAGVLPDRASQAASAKAGASMMLDSMEAIIGAVIRKSRPIPRAKQRAIARRQARERQPGR